MTVHQEIIPASDYTNVYKGEYFDYYQIHIFSFNRVLSAYYEPESTTLEQIRDRAKYFITEMIAHSQLPVTPALFEKNGKFLITYNNDILDPVELFEFDPDYVRYEPAECDDIFEFIGDVPIDVFMKNAMVSIGAGELYGEIEEQVKKLVEHQNRDIAYHAETRASDESDPKFLVEIYKIEKDYKPVLIEKVQSNNFDRTVFLPEHRYIMKSDSHFAFKAIEIATQKVVENNIKEAIELIRYTKHLKKNPPLIDTDVLVGMELDNDDPDFINGEDEDEECDDEYIPRY